METSSPLLARWLAGASSPSAIHDAHGAATYDALVRSSQQVAARLLVGSASLEGERVAILAPPGRDFVAAFFGVLLAGGAVVVLSPLHPNAETAYFLEDAGVQRVLVHASLAHHLPGDVRGSLDLAEVLAGDEAADVALPTVHADTPALQLYTSGTTARPKGAVISHRNLATQQDLLREAWGFGASDTLLHTLPLHHMHGLAIALLTALGASASVRMLPFDARATWDAMSDATVFMAVPTMYAKLFGAFDAASPEEQARWTRAARNLRLATSGSAALPVTLAERWRALTGVIPLERFGMTEVGVAISNPLVGERRAGTVGSPLPTVETRIVGEHREDVETGELWLRGPSIFLGYHQQPDATAAAFCDGWFRTGDTVTKNEDGTIRILGRSSVDILKSGGYKLSALEIEEALREHPGVAEVAVVGVPDETWGDRVVACVVARGALDAEVLRAFAKERLAPYKVPKEVRFFTDLPRNPIGKVQKPLLRAQLGAPTREAESAAVEATAAPTLVRLGKGPATPRQ
jgi:malonyl-CoA/methylmalonyl-CoA synthetase